MGASGGSRRFVAVRDLVVDQNRIAHTPVGIELDGNVEGAVLSGNAFTGVGEALRLHAPEKVTVLK